MSEIKVIVGLASGAVETGLVKIKAQFQNLRNDLNSQFGHFLAFAGIAEGLKRIYENAVQVSNVARRFGAPVEDLQRVANVAKLNGATIEDVARSWNKLAVNQQKAIDGNDEMRKTFQDLGISMNEVVNLDVSDLFFKVADATASADDRGATYANTVKLMGRNAGLLYSTLQQGSAAIKKQGDEIGVMSEEAVEGFHRIHEGIVLLGGFFTKVIGEIIVEWSKWVETIFSGADRIIQTFTIIGDQVVATAKMLKSLFTGDIEHFDWSGYKEGFKQATRDILSQAEIGKKELENIWQPSSEKKKSRVKPVDRDVPDSNEEVAKAERLKTLQEQLNEIRRKNSNEELAIQERINALVAQRAEILKKASKEKDPEKELELEIEAARIETEITAAVKERTRYIEQAQKESDKEEEERKRQEGQAPHIASNELRRIGGQQNGGFQVSGVSDKMLREQTKTNDNLVKIKGAIDKLATAPLLMK